MTSDERVDHIIRLMLEGDWHGGSSSKKLAAEWECHPKTVSDLACRASAVLKRSGAPIEQEIAQALAELDSLKALALSYERGFVVKDGVDSSHVEYVSDPQIREAISAVKLRMDILGVTSTKRGKEQTKPAVDDEYDKLTKEQRIAKLKEALALEEGQPAREDMQ